MAVLTESGYATGYTAGYVGVLVELIRGVTTHRMYARLPLHYRTADARQDPAYPLFDYIAALADQASDVEELWRRIDHTPLDEGGTVAATSDLADPDTADLAWLGWLGQFVSVTDDLSLGDTERRHAVASASSGWRGGNKAGIRAAAQSELTGTRYVRVLDHTITASSPGAASQWDVLLITRPSETPSSADVLAAVARLRAKPAGVVLRWEAYEATWNTIMAVYPTWADIEAAGTWETIQNTPAP